MNKKLIKDSDGWHRFINSEAKTCDNLHKRKLYKKIYPFLDEIIPKSYPCICIWSIYKGYQDPITFNCDFIYPTDFK